jgi:hypothetical protein
MDRIVVNAGGTKFLTTTQTLTSNSSYFASLLSGEWMESVDNMEDDLFLDQDPNVFGKLLSFMRTGMIKVEDIDIYILFLAEYLGMEKLLVAVKVRWYCNIGKGPVDLESDDAIAVAFDSVHGGITKAISNGLFQYFHKQNILDADKDLAVITMNYVPRNEYHVEVNEIVHGTAGPTIHCDHFIGALNGLHANGYTSYEYEIKRNIHVDNEGEIFMSEALVQAKFVFSRRKHSVLLHCDSSAILIPSNDDIEMKRQTVARQFALFVRINNNYDNEKFIDAPEEIDGDGQSNPYSTNILHNFVNQEGAMTDEEINSWLEKHNFTPDKWIQESITEDNWFKFVQRVYDARGFDAQIFSRTSLA